LFKGQANFHTDLFPVKSKKFTLTIYNLRCLKKHLKYDTHSSRCINWAYIPLTVLYQAFFQKNDKLYRRLRNRANRESKNLKSAFLEHKLEQLKRNPDPKKWWDTAKQIAGYPKRKSFSSLIEPSPSLIKRSWCADKRCENFFIGLLQSFWSCWS
jgi:hypothetical protein